MKRKNELIFVTVGLGVIIIYAALFLQLEISALRAELNQLKTTKLCLKKENVTIDIPLFEKNLKNDFYYQWVPKIWNCSITFHPYEIKKECEDGKIGYLASDIGDEYLFIIYNNSTCDVGVKVTCKVTEELCVEWR